VVTPKAGTNEDGIPYKNRNMFLLGNGGYVEGMTFIGLEVYSQGYPDEPFRDPTGGFAAAVRPGALINRLPYLKHLAVYTPFPPRSIISPPMDRKRGNPLVGVGGGVILADGAACSQYSAWNSQFVSWGATPVSPNGIGYLAKRGGFVNAVNAICHLAHRHFMVMSGGQMVLSGCSSQFGDYSLWSEGSTQSIRVSKPRTTSFADSFAAATIKLRTDEIIDYMWVSVISLQPRCGCVCSEEEYEAFTRKDLEYALTAIGYTVQTGDFRPVEQFARGIFDWEAKFYAPDECRPIWANWFRDLGVKINTYVATDSTKRMITEVIEALARTIEERKLKLERSLLTAINHQWSQQLAGVTRDALPTRFRNSGKVGKIRRSVVRKNGGRVRFSGQDDSGNAEFVGGMQIDARSGELRGPPFDIAIRRKATRIIFARSY